MSSASYCPASKHAANNEPQQFLRRLDFNPDQHRTYSYKYISPRLYLSEINKYFKNLKRTKSDEQVAGFSSFARLV